MISIKGLHKFFNKGRQNEIHVINGINLELPDKGMVAIFGKSGCGKTTLLNVIGGLDRFAEGSIEIDGNGIQENTDVIRNKYVGYIFQNYNLNSLESCYDNVADALRLCGMTDEDEILTRVRAALGNVGMEKYEKRTPDTLSGGQQQRIAIARAIVKNPRIILADEPTGNLDEANTVMIMDLLKAISKDHLVLLVTHEESLVDHYCDKVIELRDGKIIDERENSSATGFAARDKNDIFLGELSKREFGDENTSIEYYGDEPTEPIKLKIVNSGGKLYLEVQSDGIQILDEFSEIKLRTGIYEASPNENSVSKSIDMTSLPPIHGTRFGKLFSLPSSIKSGYTANFKGNKRGKKVLRRCMSLFSAVIVFMSAVFGSAFGDIINAKKSYNHNVFYVYTPTEAVSEVINGAVGKEESGIDYIRLMSGYPSGDSYAQFRTGSFETFSNYNSANSFSTNAVYLSVSLTENMKLLEGKKDNLAKEEILISERVADDLLKKSTLGYIKDRGDLIGLLSDMFTIDGKNLRIAGIVESGEPAIYLTDIAMAKYLRSTSQSSYTALASECGFEVNPGEAILLIRSKRTDAEYPKLGETIKIRGQDIKVIGIKRAELDYSAWLEENGIKKLDVYTYFTDIIKAEMPNLTPNSEEFHKAVDTAVTERYFEYYDYFFSEDVLKEYYRDYIFFEPNFFEAWLYAKKDVEEAKYVLISEEYYKANAYKDIYGRYPTKYELEEAYYSLPDMYSGLKEYMRLYENEFYSNNNYYSFSINTYLVHENDYIAFSKKLGETHPTALFPNANVGYDKITPYTGQGAKSLAAESVSSDIYIPDIYIGELYYTVIHSNDPDKTAKWLENEFPDLKVSGGYRDAIITPDGLFDSLIEYQRDDIITSLITMGVILAVMSICMYFIMRSSLMNRIKEVGLYRAIGVSKKNLVFKFFVEAAVLTTLTVFVGYIASSVFMGLCLSMSSLVSLIFYYPMWLSLADLIILYFVSLLFGILPILTLLRKTPSEILAKYDI